MTAWLRPAGPVGRKGVVEWGLFVVAAGEGAAGSAVAAARALAVELLPRLLAVVPAGAVLERSSVEVSLPRSFWPQLSFSPVHGPVLVVDFEGDPDVGRVLAVFGESYEWDAEAVLGAAVADVLVDGWRASVGLGPVDESPAAG